MDNLRIFKEKEINNYISNTDLNNIDVKQIKIDLRNKLGEEPAIKLNYKNEEMIMEDGSGSKKIEKLHSITVIFTVDQEVNINGMTTTQPFPVEKTFYID